jgi:aspartate ammonia-lyase
VTISMASEAGQLQLNAFEPVMLHTLMQNSAWLRRAARTLRVNCIDGITANEELLESRVSSSVGVVTALTPYIGYSEASKLAKEALNTKATIADLVVERGLLSREEVTSILSPERLSGIQAVTSAIPIITQAQAMALEDSLDRADLRDFS